MANVAGTVKRSSSKGSGDKNSSKSKIKQGTSFAVSEAHARNKTMQRELSKSLSIISLEAEISRKNLTASINCEKNKTVRFLDHMITRKSYEAKSQGVQGEEREMVCKISAPTPLLSARRSKSSYYIRPHTTAFPPHHQAVTDIGGGKMTRCPSIQTHHSNNQKHKRTIASAITKVKDKSDVYGRIQQWINRQISYNKTTGIISPPKNLLAF